MSCTCVVTSCCKANLFSHDVLLVSQSIQEHVETPDGKPLQISTQLKIGLDQSSGSPRQEPVFLPHIIVMSLGHELRDLRRPRLTVLPLMESRDAADKLHE
jgi:hypothetical protein